MGITVGDLVLAYHGVLIYDFKVLQVDPGHGAQKSRVEVSTPRPARCSTSTTNAGPRNRTNGYVTTACLKPQPRTGCCSNRLKKSLQRPRRKSAWTGSGPRVGREREPTRQLRGGGGSRRSSG
uniref:Uncharacterized protein n=1 Tax=Hyaloperonospora arabidopsidis (strain Emoy2) TaxID=559515 RepID=M4BF62_HYAAE